MGEYFRVSDKICKSIIIDEINTNISNVQNELTNIKSNMIGLSSPRKCLLYGGSLDDFQKILLNINNSLVGLNKMFSNFEVGLEEIENTSSEQINEIEIPTIHSSELRNVEFSIPAVSNITPVNITIPHEQQISSNENLTIQEEATKDLEDQAQVNQENIKSQIENDSIQDSNVEVAVSNGDSDIDYINNDSNLSSSDSYNTELENSDELSFSEIDVKEDVPTLNNTSVSTSFDNQKSEKEESSGEFNNVLAGGIAAAIGAVGAGAAFTYSKMKKNEEKDEDSKRGD